MMPLALRSSPCAAVDEYIGAHAYLVQKATAHEFAAMLVDCGGRGIDQVDMCFNEMQLTSEQDTRALVSYMVETKLLNYTAEADNHTDIQFC